jgi:hypothetical protein
MVDVSVGALAESTFDYGSMWCRRGRRPYRNCGLWRRFTRTKPGDYHDVERVANATAAHTFLALSRSSGDSAVLLA